MKLTTYSDGGARGNPGPAGCGFVIFDEDNSLVKQDSIYIGKATNNQAEYKALIYALEFINDKLQDLYKIESIECFLDSELVVKQLNGEYKVKNPGMIPLFGQVRDFVMNLGGCVSFVHIRREKNKEADRLANEAMDKGMYLSGQGSI